MARILRDSTLPTPKKDCFQGFYPLWMWGIQTVVLLAFNSKFQHGGGEGKPINDYSSRGLQSSQKLPDAEDEITEPQDKQKRYGATAPRLSFSKLSFEFG